MIDPLPSETNDPDSLCLRMVLEQINRSAIKYKGKDPIEFEDAKHKICRQLAEKIVINIQRNSHEEQRP